MADTKLTDLTADTTPGLDSVLYTVDDPGGTPASRKSTVLQAMATFGLLHTALADADTTMAAGCMYTGSMAAWATADRTYTLPANANVGDRIGICITAGNASYELIIKPAASDTINGGSAAAEWSRLFITGETVILRCVTANSAWIVEHDGRIPMYTRLVTGGVSIVASTIQRLTSAEWGAAVVNRGDGWITSGTECVFKCRRVNEFDFRCTAISAAFTSIDRQGACMVELSPNGAKTIILDSRPTVSNTGSARAYPRIADYLTVALDAEYGPTFYHTDSVNQNFLASTGFRFSVREVF